MSKTEIAKRYILFVVGLFFAAIGVAFTKHGELGVSPISSVANVLSCKFSAFSLGTWLIIWNCILIVGQIVVLREVNGACHHCVRIVEVKKKRNHCSHGKGGGRFTRMRAN